jgi:hypothetical protein
MTTTRPSLLDLHPIEVLLLVFLLSIASIARLINDPPRPFRQPPHLITHRQQHPAPPAV